MSAPDRPALAPHPPLPEYYGAPENRTAFVRGLFDRTARHYDGVNALLSLGSGRWYRRNALRRAGLGPGMRMLDVATGTGLLAREALRIIGAGGTLVGVDPSEGMLAEWRRSLGSGPTLLRGTAEALPVADASFDFVALGYALRHIPDVGAAFREFHRVLRPGGRVLVLEKVRPRSRVTHGLAKAWFGSVVPALSRFSRGGNGPEMRVLMRYYWDTVEHCIAPEVILDALRAAGFEAVGCDRQLDLFGAYGGGKRSG
ncbi:MAG TPA: class I SAM-dependent methyltransferase [Acetobacteraceae bacterium]|nr:class I SAM-dependent methyltransferase [Acetobacteraceae bacterium]